MKKRLVLLLLLGCALTGCATQSAVPVNEVQSEQLSTETSELSVGFDATAVYEDAKAPAVVETSAKKSEWSISKEIDPSKAHTEKECIANYSEDEGPYLFETPGTTLYTVYISQDALKGDTYSESLHDCDVAVSSDDNGRYCFTVSRKESEEYTPVNAYSAYVSKVDGKLKLQYTVASDWTDKPVNFYLSKGRTISINASEDLRDIVYTISRNTEGAFTVESEDVTFTLQHTESLDLLQTQDLTIYYDSLNGDSYIVEHDAVFQNQDAIDWYFAFVGQDLWRAINDLKDTYTENLQSITCSDNALWLEINDKEKLRYEDSTLYYTIGTVTYKITSSLPEVLELPDSSEYHMRMLPDFFYTVVPLAEE